MSGAQRLYTCCVPGAAVAPEALARRKWNLDRATQTTFFETKVRLGLQLSRQCGFNELATEASPRIVPFDVHYLSTALHPI
jgi:hypothetical protein